MASDLNLILPNGIYDGFAVYEGLRIKEIAGRSGTDTTTGSGTAQRTWRVSGTTSPQDARAALVDGPVLINEYDGLFIESLSYEQGPSHDTWDLTASYSAAVPDVGGYTVSVDTSGGQILQTTSYAQSKYVASGQTAPDYYGSIDVQDGKPQGVQRVIPALKVNCRAKIATEHIPSVMGYAKQVAALTGTTNKTAMFDGEFAPGELLFVGMQGDIVAENPQLTFSFLASPNVTGLTIGDITGINKAGHAYLWMLFDFAKDPTTGLLISKPRAAYVDQIYGEADHNAMKIGVAAT